MEQQTQQPGEVPWLGAFNEAVAAEYSGRPVLAVLATVAAADAPAARTIVCRRVGDDGSLWFVSDARSDKNQQLRASPAAEAVFWLASRRQQYRLRGFVQIIGAGGDGPTRREMWRGLSDASRALFAWPPPGGPRSSVAADFPAAVPADAPVPDSFEVLALQPRHVDRLDLSPHPHDRRVWQLVDGRWDATDVNP